MMKANITPRLRTLTAAAVAVFLLGPGRQPATAQDAEAGGPDPKVMREIQYAEALFRLGLPDYAQTVIDRLSATHPEAAAQVKVLKLQNLIATGKFEDVKAVIAKEPNQDSQEVWAMKLALADGFYAWARYPEARGIYESFFAKFPNGPAEGLNEFFMNSAHKYAQMLLLMGQDKAAVAAYDTLFKAKLPQHVERQALGEKTEILVRLAEQSKDPERKGFIEQAQKACEKILWVQDLWFGKAIVYMAHLKLLQGDVDGAQQLVEEYKGQLKAIDDSLRDNAKDNPGEDLTRLSPMAECRYLLGVMMQQEAEKMIAAGGGDKAKIVALLAGSTPKEGKRQAGALQHFLYVFVNYPSTTWAPDAGTRADKVEDTLTRQFGVTIKKNITPDKMEKVKGFQFQNARLLFGQQQFDQAIDAYVKVLNIFPEGEQPVLALGELARSYLEKQDETFVETTVRYVAERFGGNKALATRAGDQVLGMAEAYGERKAPMRRNEIYDLYFAHCARHPLAPALTMRVGEEKYAAKDYNAAAHYYERIVSDYTNAPAFAAALSRLAACQQELQLYSNAVRTLDRYVQFLSAQKPNQELMNAKYRLAALYRQQGSNTLVKAFNAFNDLVKTLSDPANPYKTTKEDETSNQKLLEGALYNKASCYVQLTSPPEKVQAYRESAIKVLEDLIVKFPASAYAPASLSQIGTLYTLLEKPDDAQRTLQRLQEKYPDAPEAKNALFMLGNSLLQMGNRRRAVEVFKQMFSSQGKYTDAQILSAGNELLKAGEYEIALEAFDRILAATKDRTMREPALLGRGKALIARGDFDAGAKVLDGLLQEFPRSGYSAEVCIALSRAYAELGSKEADAKKRFDIFNNSVNAMKKARSYMTTPGDRSRTDVDVARISTLKARAETSFGNKAKAAEYNKDAIAAYQTLVLLGDMNNPDTRPHIEEAFRQVVPLLLDIERWDDAVEDCDRYIESYPHGQALADARKWRSRAYTKLVVAGKVTAPPGGAGMEEAAPEPGAGTNAAAPAATATTNASNEASQAPEKK